MPEPQHAQEHGQHLARHCHGDQEQGGEALERGINEQLTKGTARAECEHVLKDRGVAGEEGHGLAEFMGIWLKEGREEEIWDVGAEEEVCAHEQRAQQVENHHHLWARRLTIPVGRLEDVVLNGVGQSVKEQIDPQERQAIDARRLRLA